jgi:hypothetical protein
MIYTSHRASTGRSMLPSRKPLGTSSALESDRKVTAGRTPYINVYINVYILYTQSCVCVCVIIYRGIYSPPPIAYDISRYIIP